MAPVMVTTDRQSLQSLEDLIGSEYLAQKLEPLTPDLRTLDLCESLDLDPDPYLAIMGHIKIPDTYKQTKIRTY